MVTLNFKNSKIERGGEMYSGPNKDMKTYVECSDCKAQFIGLKECKCGSTKTSKITVSGTQPDWFNADSK